MNQPTISERKPFLLAVLFMFLTVLLAGGGGVYVLSDPSLDDAFNLVRVANRINQLSHVEVDWAHLQQAALDKMFERLDRYSGYMEPRRWNRMREEQSGSYTGIGVSVTQHDDGLLIMSVREDGPAAAGGLLNGDVIIRVDSVILHGFDVYKATNILRGPVDSEVDLGVYRSVDQDTFEVTVNRKKINFEHIPFAGYTPDSAIYIRLLDFDAGASADLEDALDSLLEKSAHDPIGVILDLRGNPGGLFVEAYKTANLFLDDGQFIVGTDGRSRWQNEEHYSSGDDLTGGLPMVVLVDNGSASSSEIVAGSLHQLGRATLVGDTTFGKGLVQGFNRLHDGSAVRLTISRYYLANGLYLNEFDSELVDVGHGLVPDHYVTFSELSPFPRALERSLLLNQFANQFQDEIIDATTQLELGDEWSNRFEQFAYDSGFQFVSRTTSQAELVAFEITLDGLGHSARQIVSRLLTQSRADDAKQFHRHSSFIKRRLTQIAYERKVGGYTAYQKAIVPLRPDIRLAGEILKAVGQ
ncbi:MAG: S41 family peptidase [candidate division Zixibacteria bacterium]|nr:S41 family peptidase [candidate division Zixibacteria bacterium]